MGTNFYLNVAEDTFHVGKRSSGWVFDFHAFIGEDHLFESEVRTTQDWRNAMKVAEHLGGTLEDEYGSPYTFEEFWEMVERLKRSKSREVEYHWRPEEQWVDEGNDFAAYEFC